MKLEDLVGEHELSGVDFGTLPPDPALYRSEDANSITFVLDGRAYCAIEDPSDGYPSYVANFTPENMAVNQPQSVDAVDPSATDPGKLTTRA